MTTKKKATKKKATVRKKATKKKTTRKKAAKNTSTKENDEKKESLRKENEKIKKENEQLKARSDLYDDMDDTEELKTIGEGMINFSGLNNDWDEEENEEYQEDPLKELDIFERGIYLRDKESLYPEWTIKKNGAVMATKRSSYSFEDLQKEYGGGHYEIWLKDGNTKQYIKKQTTDVGEPPVRETKDDKKEYHAQSANNDKNTLMEMLALITQLQSSSTRDKAETSKATVEAQTLSNQMIMQSMQQMQSQNTESMKMMMQMIKTSQENTAKMIEGMAKSIKDSQKNNDGFTMKDILAMQEESKSRAAKEMRQYMDMAKEMVEERMAYTMESKSDDAPKSSMDKLIDNLAPAITNLLMQKPQTIGGQPGQTSQQAYPQNPVQQRQMVDKYRNEIGGDSRPSDITSVEAKNTNSIGAPRFIGRSSMENGGAQNFKDVQVEAPKPSKTKEEILNAVLPIVTDDLIQRNSSQDSAKKSVEVVLARGFTNKEILDNFKLKDIIAIADQYSLPQEAYPWLKEYYGEIENRCGKSENDTAVGPEVGIKPTTIETSAKSVQ